MNEPSWASFSGSTVSSVVNWSIFGLHTSKSFSSGLGLAGSQFAFLCFLKHSNEQLKVLKIIVSWFLKKEIYLVVYPTITYQLFSHRGHLYFFVVSSHSKHFIFQSLVWSIKETKPKQCANTCQNWHVTSKFSFSTHMKIGVEVIKSDIMHINNFIVNKKNIFGFYRWIFKCLIKYQLIWNQENSYAW